MLRLELVFKKHDDFWVHLRKEGTMQIYRVSSMLGGSTWKTMVTLWWLRICMNWIDPMKGALDVGIWEKRPEFTYQGRIVFLCNLQLANGCNQTVSLFLKAGMLVILSSRRMAWPNQLRCQLILVVDYFSSMCLLPHCIPRGLFPAVML